MSEDQEDLKELKACREHLGCIRDMILLWWILVALGAVLFWLGVSAHVGR